MERGGGHGDDAHDDRESCASSSLKLAAKPHVLLRVLLLSLLAAAAIAGALSSYYTGAPRALHRHKRAQLR